MPSSESGSGEAFEVSAIGGHSRSFPTEQSCQEMYGFWTGKRLDFYGLFLRIHTAND